MNTFVVDRESISIPEWVKDHAAFRRWYHSDEFPDDGRVCYLQGEVWVDMSKEQVFSHNQVKNEYSFVLTGLARQQGGRFFPDGVLLTNEDAELSARPDGIYVSEATLDSEAIRLVEGEDEGFVELQGSPDMVMEMISASSVKKDKVIQPPLYWAAKIKEYWLVDVRGERLEFDIFRRGSKGYVATRKAADWVKSAVFGRAFRLSRSSDRRGNPVYRLEVR